MKWLAVPLALLAASASGAASEAPEQAKTVAAQMIFPRFTGGATELEKNSELRKALEGIPTLTFKDGLFPFSFRSPKGEVGGLTIRVEFQPAKADVGDVAKAVAPVQGREDRRNHPAAILMVPTDVREGLTEDQLQSLWKQLSKVKGVNVEASRQLKQSIIIGIVLEETGQARLQPIVEAVEATGAKVRRP